MYQPNLYPHSTAPSADAIYHQHMIPTSVYPTAPHMVATVSQSDLPTALSNPDISAHAADASIDTTNQMTTAMLAASEEGFNAPAT